jgi:hypothetical protein
MLRKVSVFILLIGVFSMICGCSVSFAEDAIFDGDLEVGDGVEITLSPTGDLVSQATLSAVSVGKSVYGWGDVVEYEKGIAGANPAEAVNIDNLWAARINKIMALTEQKYGVAPELNSALEALTVPPQRPSGIGPYSLTNSRVPYVGGNLNEGDSIGNLVFGATTSSSGSAGAAAAQAAGITPLPASSGTLPVVTPEEEPTRSPDDVPLDSTTTPYPPPP